MRNKKYNELVILYQTKGLHKKGVCLILTVPLLSSFLIPWNISFPQFFSIPHLEMLEIHCKNICHLEELHVVNLGTEIITTLEGNE